MLQRPPPSAPCCSCSSSARRQRPERTIVARAASSSDLAPLANSSPSAPPAASSPSCSSSSSPSRGSRSTARATQGPVYAAGLLEEVEVEQLRVSSPPDDAGDSSSSKTALEEERSLLARSLAASDDEVRFAFCFISHGDRGTKALAWTWARTFESPWHGSESGSKANSFQPQSSLALLALLFLRFLLSLPLFQPPSLAPLDSSLCPSSPTIIRFRARRVH